jgi:hypothetical protein
VPPPPHAAKESAVVVIKTIRVILSTTAANLQLSYNARRHSAQQKRANATPPEHLPRPVISDLAHRKCLRYVASMTNQIAIWLAIFIVGFFVLDHFVFQMDALTVVMRLILSAIKKIAFWR